MKLDESNQIDTYLKDQPWILKLHCPLADPILTTRSDWFHKMVLSLPHNKLLGMQFVHISTKF